MCRSVIHDLDSAIGVSCHGIDPDDGVRGKGPIEMWKQLTRAGGFPPQGGAETFLVDCGKHQAGLSLEIQIDRGGHLSGRGHVNETIDDIERRAGEFLLSHKDVIFRCRQDFIYNLFCHGYF